MKRNNLFQENEFRNWLLNEKGMTHRVISDYVSRCKRVQNIFEITLNSSIKTEKRYISIMEDINSSHFLKNLKNANFKSVAATLRLAVRTYAIFLLGEKAIKYPKCYSIRISE